MWDEKWTAVRLFNDGTFEVISTGSNLIDLKQETSQTHTDDVFYIPDTKYSKLDTVELTEIISLANDGRLLPTTKKPNRNNVIKHADTSSCTGRCYPKEINGQCWCICYYYIGNQYYLRKCNQC